MLRWTIAMLNLGVGPWTGEATRQEVETWVSCCKSIVLMSVVAVSLSSVTSPFFCFSSSFSFTVYVLDTLGCVPVWGFDIRAWLSPPPGLFWCSFASFLFRIDKFCPSVWWLGDSLRSTSWALLQGLSLVIQQTLLISLPGLWAFRSVHSVTFN